MFFLYIFWNLIFILLDKSHVFIENFFLVKNNPFLMRKRTFKFLSYFEKIILVLFYKKGWFEKSIANLYRKKDILDYRRKNYPIIYSFHINHDKVDYILEDLRLLCKQYKYYTNNKLYENKFKKILNFCFKVYNRNFLKFLILNELLIRKYFNFLSYTYFNSKNNKNLVKFNRLFNIFILRSSKKLVNFNLDIWYDWYSYNFDKNILKFYKLNNKLSKQDLKKIKDFKFKKIYKWIAVVYHYKKRIVKFNYFLGKKFKGIIYFRLNLSNYFKIKIKNDYFKLLKYYIIKFSESSVTKHITTKNLKEYKIYYLRKNRIFNKGRYSRNRQLYRTGVYWCLWLNIIMVYGLYFIFYRFTFNFGYFWWGILILSYSTIFSRISKYNFFNINYIIKELMYLINWYGFIFHNCINTIESLLKYYFIDINILNYMVKYKKTSFNFIFNSYYFYFIKYFVNYLKKKKRIKIVYMWQGMKEKDTSFMRYKTIIHWFKEIFRLIVT